MTSFEFFEYTPSLAPEWDKFVTHSRFGSVHQVSSWADFQKTIPGRGTVLGFGVRDAQNGQILATTFCVKMETGFSNKFWWYSARGPVFDPHTDSEAGRFLIKKVQSHLRETGALFWRFDPYFSRLDFEFLHLTTVSATQDYQPTDTLELDLKLSKKEILSQMKRKGRYNIKVAQKNKLQASSIPEGKFTDTDLNDFWELNAQTTSRDGFSGHEKEYYRQFLTFLKEYAVLFFVETKDNVRIATAISTFCGDKAIYYFGASTSDKRYKSLMAPYLLQWEMIQYAQEKECLTYDFLGIAPKEEPNHKYAGISQFKWKFGGKRKTYAAGREILLRPFWYGLYRLLKWWKRL